MFSSPFSQQLGIRSETYIMRDQLSLHANAENRMPAQESTVKTKFSHIRKNVHM